MTTVTAPMSLRLDRTTREKLDVIARRQKRSAHAIATEAITALVLQTEQDYAFNQSCVDSYNHYKETGLHATHDEVFAWLESVGTPSELPPPVCHT